MSQFEFFMMIASVVVAVAIAEIIGGWGKILRDRNVKVRYDWLHLGVSITLPLTIIQYWMGMWAYSLLEITTNLQVLFLVVPSTFGVLAAFIITPNPDDSQTLDCRDYYMSRRKPYFFTQAAFVLSAGLADIVVIGPETMNPEFLVTYAGIPLFMLYLAWTPRVWVHAAMLGVGVFFLTMFYLSDFAMIANRNLL